MKRAEQHVEVVPFDVERVLTGDALVLVSVGEGRPAVLGRIVDREWMYRLVGEPIEVPRTREAKRQKETDHTRAVLLTGGLTALGRRDAEIVAELAGLGLIRPETDPENRIRTVKRWRAEYRRIHGRVIVR